MRVLCVGRIQFRYTQRIRKEIREQIERKTAARIEEATFQYSDVEGERAEFTGRAYLKDGRLFSFFGVFTPDDGVEIMWTQLEGTQISM